MLGGSYSEFCEPTTPIFSMLSAKCIEDKTAVPAAIREQYLTNALVPVLHLSPADWVRRVQMGLLQ
jgi:hypothetical protein